MIAKRDGNTVTYYSDDMDRVLFVVTYPDNVTVAEFEAFREHLLREIKKQEAGPS